MKIFDWLRGSGSERSRDDVVINSGDAVGHDAVTGIRGKRPRRGSATVINSGDAIAKDGGSAVSGIDYSGK